MHAPGWWPTRTRPAPERQVRAAERGRVDAEADELARVVAAHADPGAVAASPTVRRIVAGATPFRPYGRPNGPLAVGSPFRTGFSGAVGVAAVVLLLLAAQKAQTVLVLVLVSAFLAVSLDPLVALGLRLGLRRGPAVAVVSLRLLAVVAGFVAAAVPAVTTEVAELSRQAPQQLAELRGQSGPVGAAARAFRAPSGSEVARVLAGGALDVGLQVVTATFNVVTVLVLTVYLLAAKPSVERAGLRLVPRSRRARVGLLTEAVLARVGRYMLGNLVTSAIAGVATALFLLWLGVPYPLFLGLLVALFDLVPIVGAPLAGLVIAVVALTVSVPTALASAAFTAAFRLLEDYLISPRVMRRAVEVPGVVTVVAVLLGGSLLGVVGALLAIPVAAGAQLLLDEVVVPRQDAA